jgi:YidC/Oxa1 family membrane protein insertase
MNSENKNAFIGMLLIVGILVAWNLMMQPSEAQLAEQKRVADSTLLVQKQLEAQKNMLAQAPIAAQPDSARRAALSAEMGDFSKLALGSEQLVSVENEVLKATFSTRGGRLKEVWLKNQYKIWEDSAKVEHKSDLKLFENPSNKFELILPANNGKGFISTADLFFTPTITGNTVVLRAALNDQSFIEKKFSLSTGYEILFEPKVMGLGNLLKSDAKSAQFYVENNLSYLEMNASYEKNYSYLHYKEKEETPTYLAATSNDGKDLNIKPVDWVAHSNQFFSTIFMSGNGGFKSVALGTNTDDASALKRMVSKFELPLDASGNLAATNIKIFVGPKDYKLLKSYKLGIEDVVNYGGSVLGTINRWFIRPIFDFLQSIFGNVAVCILLLTLIVKAMLYPLSYRMIQSQAKTTALKPEIEKLKLKHKDDAQKLQVEQMKLYGEFGVNPLGGCLPTLLQMPIWMALFNFFPASIDFRQKAFLWANDLTGFEQFVKLPFYIPLYGSHISLFALLWGASLVIFTWYSMKDMDMSSQPAGMKQLQFVTPVLFTVMFNSYAAGLSLYMLFSNVLNIGQTVITKNYVIDNDKIRETLLENKKKPKKKSAFRAKFDEMMEQQQQLKQVQEREKGKKK